MKKLIMTFLLIVAVNSPLEALPFSLSSTLAESADAFTKSEQTPPNPKDLNPQWWKYFDVDLKEFAQRVQTATLNLQGTYPSLNASAADQEIAAKRITGIITNFNTILATKKLTQKEPAPDCFFLKSYTLEQQFEINHKIRKLKVEIKNQEEEHDLLKAKIHTGDKFIDNLMVPYLALEKGSSAKILSGFDVILRRSAIGVLEANKVVLKGRIEANKTELVQLEKELNASVKVLNVALFDEGQLEKNMQAARKQYDDAQLFYLAAEANTYEVLGDTPHDRSMRYYLEQKVNYAAIYKTLSWSLRSLEDLKYNLVLDLNERFQSDKDFFRNQLNAWKEKLKTINHQMKEWRTSANKEQDRVRQDYAMLIAQNESDQKLLRLNQNRRQESINGLNALQVLEDKLNDVQWMISLHDNHIKENSGVMERSWFYAFNLVNSSLATAIYSLNFSLFTISGFPITLFILIKIALIIVAALYASRYCRSALLPMLNQRGRFSDSTLYYAGRLLHFFILIMGVIAGLITIGFDFGNLFILAGALFFGIGFGFQSVANNILCGFRILFERKIKMNDYIELASGEAGKVSQIHLQHTVILTSDGKEIIVPNSELIDKTLSNWTMSNDYKRYKIPFSTAGGMDKELIRKIVPECAKKVPCTAKEGSKYGQPQICLVKFSEYQLDFELIVWVNMKVKSFTESREGDFLWEIDTALREHGVKLPSECQRLYLEYPGDRLVPQVTDGKGKRVLLGESGV